MIYVGTHNKRISIWLHNDKLSSKIVVVDVKRIENVKIFRHVSRYELNENTSIINANFLWVTFYSRSIDK